VFVLTEDTPLEIIVKDLAGNEVKESRTVSKQKPSAPAQPSGNTWQDAPKTDTGAEAPAVTEEQPQEIIADVRAMGDSTDERIPRDSADDGEADIDGDTDNPDSSDEEIRGDAGADDAKDYPTAVLGASIEITPDTDKPAVNLKEILERIREAWKELPTPAKTAVVTVSSIIGAGLLWYGLLMILGTAKVSWINEEGKSRFLARLPIRKEEGCISLHLRKKAMQSAKSCRIRISLPRYYTKLHRYLPLMFSYGGRIYPMHIEERMELNLDDIS
jgi:hypothetical protein